MEVLRRLEVAARERLEPAVFDLFAGGAGDERTLADNEEAWRRVWLRPRGLVDVAHVDSSLTLLGHHLRAPVLLAPIAAHALVHPDGERATARAAAAAQTLFVLSTRATTDLADVAAAAPHGARWLQLYVERDRARTAAVVARAAAHGYARIVVTIDLPVAGRRERELRHGDVILPEGVAVADHLGGAGTTGPRVLGGWDASLTWEDLSWVGEASGLPVLVKGVLTAEDALAAERHGAEAVIVSNHGGRQLDGCVPTAVALREVAGALGGRLPVLVDGGVRDGADVLRALALGADAVMIGRPYVWGLAAEGEDGVRAVLDAFARDLERVMALAGCPALADVAPDRVRLAGW